MSKFPIGAYVRLTDSTMAKVRNSLRNPCVLRVVKVQSQEAVDRGEIAVEALSGPLAYKSFHGPPEMVEPANPCYGCHLSQPLNDRDWCRCTKHDQLVNSAETCESWTKRRPVGVAS